MKTRNIGKLISMAYDSPIDENVKKQTALLAEKLYSGKIQRNISAISVFRLTFSRISVTFWLVSALIYILVGITDIGQTFLIVTAPMIAALGFSEWLKSFYYSMWELESTCLLDLRRLLLLKFALTGIANTMLIVVANLFAKGTIPILNNAVFTMSAFAGSCLCCFLIFDITKKADPRLLFGISTLLCGGLAVAFMTIDQKHLSGSVTIPLVVLALITVFLFVIVRMSIRREELCK